MFIDGFEIECTSISPIRPAREKRLLDRDKMIVATLISKIVPSSCRFSVGLGSDVCHTAVNSAVDAVIPNTRHTGNGGTRFSKLSVNSTVDITLVSGLAFSLVCWHQFPTLAALDCSTCSLFSLGSSTALSFFRHLCSLNRRFLAFTGVTT